MTTLIVTATFAALVGYGLHHLGPLDEHAPVVALLALAATALAAARLGATLAPASLPPVFVVGARRPDIRSLDRSETAFCAALHSEALPHGFFASLGDRFLQRYYASFVASPHAIAITATVNGHQVGYLVGTVRARAHRQWLLKHHGVALALSGSVALSLRPRVAARFIRTRLARYRTRLRRVDRAPIGAAAASDVAVLSHVAVLDGARHTGAGTELVARFEQAARESRTSKAYLTTIEGADGAGPFYERLGWRPGPSHPTPDGDRMREWTKNLDEVGRS